MHGLEPAHQCQIRFLWSAQNPQIESGWIYILDNNLNTVALEPFVVKDLYPYMDHVTIEAEGLGFSTGNPAGVYYIAIAFNVKPGNSNNNTPVMVYVKNWKMTIYDEEEFTEQEVSNNTFTYQPHYRYGFNGQERDDEITGTGNSYTAEYWQYDPRLGRRWNIDPIDKPWMSSYHAFSDSPIWKIDPNGALDTKYETEDGTPLAETKDGNEETVEIGNEDIVDFLLDYVRMVSDGKKDDLMRNGGLIAKYGKTSQTSVVDPVDLSGIEVPYPPPSTGSLREYSYNEQLVAGMLATQGPFAFRLSSDPVIQAEAQGMILGPVVSSTFRIAKPLIQNVKIPIYRVYGGASRINGKSWTFINPKLMPSSVYRNYAGLPSTNWGTRYIKGSVKIREISEFRRALSTPSTKGGFPELLIRDPSKINYWKYMQNPGLFNSYLR